MNYEIIIDALEEKIIGLVYERQVHEAEEKALKYLVKLVCDLIPDAEKKIITLNIEGKADAIMGHDGVEHFLLGAFNDYEKSKKGGQSLPF